jgi:hypothetical protein
LEDGPIFQELKAEGLAMQHRFAAGPIFAKTGKGFLISEGVANSPAFGQFGFRLEMSRTGTIQASVGGKLEENTTDPDLLGDRERREIPMKTGYLKWCPDQELNLDQRFRKCDYYSFCLSLIATKVA